MLDPETAGNDLFYKVTSSTGKVTFDTARTWGKSGNANVLASRQRDRADQDARDKRDDAKAPTHQVDQVTREEYLRNKPGWKKKP